MATIDSLATSITKQTPEEFRTLVATIRNNRKTRPQKKLRAKTTRKTTKKNPKQLNLFALISTMSKEEKLSLATTLRGLEG